MASPEVLDFAKLLAPIPGDKPAGDDLRSDNSPVSDYYAIRDARKLASDSERRIDKGDENVDPPDWRPVLERATKALSQKTKDLELAAYLIESLVRLKGFAGLRDGYRLSRELVEQFWDGLYPTAQDGEVQDRFSHILYLNGIDGVGALIVPVRKIPLTERTGEGPFNLTHHQQARSLAQLADAKLRQKRIDEGAVTLDMIQAAVAATPAKFYADLIEDLGQAAEEFRKFCGALGAKSGFDPPSSELLGVLESYLDTVKDLARDKIPKAPAAAPAASEAGAPASEAEPAKPVDPGVIRSREDAFDRLRKIADYFREHEPQSIIPYALDQVANWGKMSLPDLLSELIPEEAPRKNVFKQVGIKLPEAKK
ncbi:MAG: type VI secretion system protein TssA [Isosphaeraceae bacterium]